MVKSKQVLIRISIEQHKFIKEMDGSFSQIWQIGFEKWANEFPEYLQSKAKEYDKLYKQCIFKMQNCVNDRYLKYNDLNKLLKEYLEKGRSLDAPSIQDINWVKARVTKLKGVNTKKFYDYGKGILDDKKQKLLGDIFDK